MSKEHYSAYDEETTARCERALVTLLGDIGPWGNRIYLAGGLAPRYIVGSLPEGARPHVGTTDVDLVIGLTVNDQSDEAYRTLENNLRKSDFEPENSFRWSNRLTASRSSWSSCARPIRWKPAESSSRNKAWVPSLARSTSAERN